MSDGDVPFADEVVEDVMEDADQAPGAGASSTTPPLPHDHSMEGLSTKQILLFSQGALVIIVVIVMIVMFLCRSGKKKDEKKLEDTNYPSVEQVWEEQKQTRSQVTLRKTQTTEEATEC